MESALAEDENCRGGGGESSCFASARGMTVRSSMGCGRDASMQLIDRRACVLLQSGMRRGCCLSAAPVLLLTCAPIAATRPWK